MARMKRKKAKGGNNGPQPPKQSPRPPTQKGPANPPGNGGKEAALQAEVSKLTRQLAELKPLADAHRQHQGRLNRERQALTERLEAVEEREAAVKVREAAVADGSRLDAEVRRRHQELDDLKVKLDREAAEQVETARSRASAEHRKAATAWAAEERKRRKELGSAEADAQEHRRQLVDDARKEAARLLEEARRQLDEEFGKARADLETWRLEQQGSLEEERRVATEQRETLRAALEEERRTLDERAEGLWADVRKRESEVAEAQRVVETSKQELATERADLDLRRRSLEADRAQFEREQDAAEELRERYDEAEVARLRADLADAEAVSERRADKLVAATEQIESLRAELQRRDGPSLEQLRQELESLRAERDVLSAELAERPDSSHVESLRSRVARAEVAEQELLDLRERNRELEHLQAGFERERRRLDQGHARELEERNDAILELESQLKEGEERNDALQTRLVEAEVTAEQTQSWAVERERMKTRTEWQDAEIGRLQADLDRYTKAQEERTGSTYGLIAGLDKAHAKPPEKPLRPSVRSASLVKRLVKGLAHEELYYAERDVAAFVAGLATTRIGLLKGISGTGKTSLVRRLGRLLGAEVAEIPVQSGWRERSDLIGYYNTFSYRFLATDFTAALYRARCPEFAKRPFFILLDEVNLARVEYYFADLLSLLEFEPERQLLRLMDEHPPEGVQIPNELEDHGRILRVPENVFFFGTANEDGSTFEITDKVHDRSTILQLDRRHAPVRGVELAPLPATASAYTGQAALDPKHEATLTSFEGAMADALRPFRVGIGHRFGDQLRRFLPVMTELGQDPGVALDHFVETRLLHKIRRIRDVGRAGEVEQLRGQLDTLWPRGWGEPERSGELLDATAKRLRS